ncbi:MAG TPA: hypothetical protein VFC95_02780 [Guyparkeria sp.]|nr:hypothetical protein [Guyparkeria sp.]
MSTASATLVLKSLLHCLHFLHMSIVFHQHELSVMLGPDFEVHISIRSSTTLATRIEMAVAAAAFASEAHGHGVAGARHRG